MSLFTTVWLFISLILPLVPSEVKALTTSVPRKIIPYQNDLKTFQENNVFNYTTILLREDLGLLFLGAREAVYALDMSNVSQLKAVVYWKVSSTQQTKCTNKGKNAEIECRNYVKTLERLDDGRMFVCGTNAFYPICDNMTFVDGHLELEGQWQEGRGRIPYNPFERHSSVMLGPDLYSASPTNFLGSETVFQRFSSNPLRTELRNTWLNEPKMVQMLVVPESVKNAEGDDDKIYLFFTEEAIDIDFPGKVRVSRVARVCKGDTGGQRTLQGKWTSFLKARLDCPLPSGSSLPAIVQDVFLLRDKNWRKSIFYAVFTPQSAFSEVSSVCAFSVSDVGLVFSQGGYWTPKDGQGGPSEEEPVPRPGACINNVARDMGIESSQTLPDSTLLFAQDRPLMVDPIPLLTSGPLVLKRGATFSKIVVDIVEAVDGRLHNVMFIGTDDGKILKAVNYAGDPVIVKEVQVFQTPEPVKVLRLSSNTGQLFAGSDSGVVQMPLRDCGRYDSCVDCVLARDPYCGWDTSTASCSPVPLAYSMNMIQSLESGDGSMCPVSVYLGLTNHAFSSGDIVYLPCQSDSNLAQVHWHFSGKPLQLSAKHLVHNSGIYILDATKANAGIYTCEAVEEVKGRLYRRTLAAYQLQTKVSLSLIYQVAVVALSVVLLVLGIQRFSRPGRRALARPAEPGENPDVALTVQGPLPYHGEPGVDLDLLCWGSGELGQTGRNVQGYVGPEEAQLRGFTLGKLGRVKLLACGSSHSIVVTVDDRIFAWGNGTSGQLGDGEKAVKTQPVEVLLQSQGKGRTCSGGVSGVMGVASGGVSGVMGVACGGRHSFVWTEEGQAYSFGNNFYAQLGYDFRKVDFKEHQLAPRLFQNLPASRKICQVACGERHSLFALEDGSVAACGVNDYGQIGSGFPENAAVPRMVEGLENVLDITCGANHNLALTADGILFQWGCGRACGNLRRNILSPEEVMSPGSAVRAMAGGYWHSVLLTDNGRQSEVWCGAGDRSRGWMSGADLDVMCPS
ncbi:semaphorin-4E-like [Osmerus eperlanus]|uniref:semaphorin-4E-like n=1 Tax=Osmerus eperlanus TaxID=29151 RepID=UPI002E0DEEB7